MCQTAWRVSLGTTVRWMVCSMDPASHALGAIFALQVCLSIFLRYIFVLLASFAPMVALKLDRALLGLINRTQGDQPVTLAWLDIFVRVSGIPASQAEYIYVLPDIFVQSPVHSQHPVQLGPIAIALDWVRSGSA